jgi:hypothetical protein
MKNTFKLTALSLYIASCLPAVGFADSVQANEHANKANETVYIFSKLLFLGLIRPSMFKGSL